VSEADQSDFHAWDSGTHKISLLAAERERFDARAAEFYQSKFRDDDRKVAGLIAGPSAILISGNGFFGPGAVRITARQNR